MVLSLRTVSRNQISIKQILENCIQELKKRLKTETQNLINQVYAYKQLKTTLIGTDQMGASQGGCFKRVAESNENLGHINKNTVGAHSIQKANWLHPNLQNSREDPLKTASTNSLTFSEPQEVISHVQKLIQMYIPEQSHLVNSDCFDKVFIESDQCHMEEEDVLQLLQTFKTYLETCQLNDNTQINSQLQQVATKMFTILNGVHFKSLNALKVVQQFFSVAPFPVYINYNELKFDPQSEEEYLKVAQIAKNSYEYDDHAFLFLTDYLVNIAKRMSKEGKDIKAIDRRLEQILKDLAEKHPPNGQIPTGAKDVKIESQKSESPPQAYKSIDLSKFPPKERNLQVEQFILGISAVASENIQNLVLMTKSACLENNGLHYKTGVKVKGPNSKIAIERVKEKLFAKSFKKLDIKEGQNLDQFLKKEEKAYQQQIAHIIEEQNTLIQFTVSDMLRGKCMFQSIPEINRTAQQFIQNSHKRGFPIREIDNRLAKKTTDLVFKMEIQGVVSEFQLAFQFNVVRNEFNHKIYQLLRSKFFSVTTTVFKFNQQFSDYTQRLIRVMEKMKAKLIDPRSFFQGNPQDSVTNLMNQLQKRFKKMPREASFETRRISELLKIINQQAANIRNKKLLNKSKQQFKLFWSGVFYDNLQQKEKAESCLSTLVRDGSLPGNQNDARAEEMIILLERLGDISNKKGDYRLAVERYEECLKIQQRIRGKEHIDCATTLNNIGFNCTNKGEYDLALKYYQECLEIKNKALGKDHVKCAITINNIGQVYFNKGEFDLALKYYKESLQIRYRVQGKDHFDCALTLNNIGLAYFNKGQYGLALQFYEESLEINERSLGKEHIECAVCLNNIGTVYYITGKHDLVLKYLGKCLEIQQKVRGRNHIDCVTTLNNIAQAYFRKKEYDLALKYLGECLQIQWRVLGKEHIKCAATLNNIGSVYIKKEQYELALNYCGQALKAIQQVKGKGHIDYAITLQNLGMAHYKKGDVDLALKCYQESLETQYKAIGKGHVYSAFTLSNIGQVYKSKGDYELALKYYRECLEIRERVQGKNSDDCIQMQQKIQTVKKLML